MADDDELHLVCLDSRPVRTLLRYMALVVGCMAVGVAFCFELFAVYGQPLKVAFDFSQKEITLIMSAASLGMISAFPSGILVQKYDARWLSGGAFMLSTVSCLLVWGTTYHVAFYKQYYYVLAIFYFLLGCAGGFMYILALSVNLSNFDKRHSGAVSGVIHCMRSVVFGTLLILTDYVNGFDAYLPAVIVPPSSGGTVINVTTISGSAAGGDGRENIRFLQQLFQVSLLVYAGVNFMACMFYGEYRVLAAETSDNFCDESGDSEMTPIRPHTPKFYGTQSIAMQTVGTQTPTDTTSGGANGIIFMSSSPIRLESPWVTPDTSDLLTDSTHEPPGAPRTWFGLLRSLLFRQLLWPSVFLFALRNTYVTNLSTIMACFGLQEELRWPMYCVPIVGIVFTLVLGPVADRVGHRVPRSLVYFLLALILLVVNLFNTGFGGDFPVVVLTVICSQLAASCVMTLGPSLHLKFFDAVTLPAGWGMLTLLQTVFTLLTQVLIDVLYEAFTPPGALMCTGFKCYIVYFLFCALLAYSSAVRLFYVVRHEFNSRSNAR